MFDPPFFYITLEDLAKGITTVCGDRIRDVKLLMSFMIKDEGHVISAFRAFNLTKTNFELEYATVKANRWDNYGLYANTDLPFIKRIKKKTKGQW